MFPSKHLSKQYLFKTWPCPSWDGLWAFVGFGLLGLGLGLGLYLLQRLTRKTLNVKANDLVLHYKKPPLVDSHHMGCILIWLYPEKASKKLSSFPPEALSTRASILGRG